MVFGGAAVSLLVDPSDPSEVERVAKKYMRKRIRLFDTNLNILVGCFEAAPADGTNTIFLIPEVEISIDEELETSVFELVSNANTERDHKRGRH